MSLRGSDSGLPRPDVLVGVVVPARDAERWVGPALRSLQAQTLTSWCCVVVDDGSTDSTADVVERVTAGEPRITVLRQAGSGVSAARNAGLAALPHCRYVAFLDSDDLYLPDALEVLVRALEARPDAVAAYGLAEYIGEDGEPIQPGLHPERQRWRRQLRGNRLVLQSGHEDLTFDSLVVDDPVWPAAVALHRACEITRAGGFDESLAMLEDWDLHLRVARRGPYVAVDRPVALYRRHHANLTSQHDASQFHRERVRRAAWLTANNAPAENAAIVKAWRLLERRQTLVLGRHVVRSLARRRWASALEAGVGVVVSALTSLRLGPPPPSRLHIRLTRPDDLLDVPL